MKIALYYPWIYLKSGVERTILEIVKRSKHEYTIFTNHYDKKNTYPEFRKYKVVELKKAPVDRGIASVFKAALTIAFQKINLTGYDLLLVHCDGMGDLVLLRNAGVPTVCFCHTPLRPVFDFEYRKRALKKRGCLNKSLYIILSGIFKYIDRFLWKKYKLILFNGRESLRRAKEGGLLGSTKYHLLNPGVDFKKNRPPWRFEKYFFVPGRIMWTKNIELAIEAFKIFEKVEKKRNFKLIIAGQVDAKSKPYLEKLRSLAKTNNKIIFITDPLDKKMNNLYKNCYAVLATSFNEDWGMTALEANSFGKAVIAVNKGGFLESQIDGKTGFLLEGKSNVFSSAMIRLVKDIDLTKRLGKGGFVNVQKYSVDKFIKGLDGILGGLH